jgi:hypothetical protein
MLKKGVIKFRVALIAYAFASAHPVRAADLSFPDYSGAWRIVTYGKWRAHPLCFFDQTGNRLTGSCRGLTNEGKVEGIVDGNGLKLNWDGKPYRSCGERLCTCSCTFAGKRITASHIIGTAKRRGVTVPFEGFKRY